MILFKVENQRKHDYIQNTKSKLDIDFVEAKEGIERGEKIYCFVDHIFQKGQ